MNELKRQRYIQSLKFRIKCLFDNSQERSKHSNGRPLKGLKKRLTGKEGQLRNNLMGKRVDKSARTVIGPDPTLKVNEIAIPYEIADVLTYPVYVNRYNIDELKKELYNNNINYVVKKGTGVRMNMKYALYKQGDKLQFGDYILKKNGEYIFIKNEKQFFLLESDDTVIRNGKKWTNFQHPSPKSFDIEIGDIIERKIRNGDILLLNRQPTQNM
jgi:DNA-directed RNA polymerase beta' subunit